MDRNASSTPSGTPEGWETVERDVSPSPVLVPRIKGIGGGDGTEQAPSMGPRTDSEWSDDFWTSTSAFQHFSARGQQQQSGASPRKPSRSTVPGIGQSSSSIDQLPSRGASASPKRPTSDEPGQLRPPTGDVEHSSALPCPVPARQVTSDSYGSSGPRPSGVMGDRNNTYSELDLEGMAHFSPRPEKSFTNSQPSSLGHTDSAVPSATASAMPGVWQRSTAAMQEPVAAPHRTRVVSDGGPMLNSVQVSTHGEEEQPLVSERTQPFSPTNDTSVSGDQDVGPQSPLLTLVTDDGLDDSSPRRFTRSSPGSESPGSPIISSSTPDGMAINTRRLMGWYDPSRTCCALGGALLMLSAPMALQRLFLPGWRLWTCAGWAMLTYPSVLMVIYAVLRRHVARATAAAANEIPKASVSVRRSPRISPRTSPGASTTSLGQTIAGLASELAEESHDESLTLSQRHRERLRRFFLPTKRLLKGTVGDAEWLRSGLDAFVMPLIDGILSFCKNNLSHGLDHDSVSQRHFSLSAAANLIAILVGIEFVAIPMTSHISSPYAIALILLGMFFAHYPVNWMCFPHQMVAVRRNNAAVSVLDASVTPVRGVHPGDVTPQQQSPSTKPGNEKQQNRPQQPDQWDATVDWLEAKRTVLRNVARSALNGILSLADAMEAHRTAGTGASPSRSIPPVRYDAVHDGENGTSASPRRREALQEQQVAELLDPTNPDTKVHVAKAIVSGSIGYLCVSALMLPMQWSPLIASSFGLVFLLVGISPFLPRRLPDNVLLSLRRNV